MNSIFGWSEGAGTDPTKTSCIRVTLVGMGKDSLVVHGVPEFHRQAADDAAERVEHARERLEASQVVMDELDALLAETDSAALS